MRNASAVSSCMTTGMLGQTASVVGMPLSTPELAVTLHGPKVPIRVGMPIPIRIEVRNLSQRDVWFAGVLDGSEEGARYPHYLPQIIREGQIIAKAPRPEWSPVGPLRFLDFRLLAPGESFDPTSPHLGAVFFPISTFCDLRAAEAGCYEITLTLSTESLSPEQWSVRFEEDIERAAALALVAQVPRLTVSSNVLEVMVT